MSSRQVGNSTRGAHLKCLLQHSLLKGLQDLRCTAACIVEILGASHLLHQKLYPLLRALGLIVCPCFSLPTAVFMGMTICFCCPCNVRKL